METLAIVEDKAKADRYRQTRRYRRKDPIPFSRSLPGMVEPEAVEASKPESLIEKLSHRDGFLDSEQVRKMLGIHITTLQLWTKHQEIPFLRVGHLIRFDPVQLARWLQQRQMGI